MIPPARLRIMPTTSRAVWGAVVPMPTLPATSMKNSWLRGKSVPRAGIDEAEMQWVGLTSSCKPGAHQPVEASGPPAVVELVELTDGPPPVANCIPPPAPLAEGGTGSVPQGSSRSTLVKLALPRLW